jgi:hypothetical protein
MSKTEVISYSVTDSAIAAMKKEYMPLVVKDANDKEGREACHKAQMAVREKRIEVEERRKELKADALAYGKKVDSEAARISTQLEEIEAHLKAQKEIVDNEEKRLKAERDRKDKEELDRRISLMQSFKAVFSISELALMTEDAFSIRLATARTEFEAAEKKRLDDEEELRQLRAKQEEDRKQREAQEAENKKLRDQIDADQKRKLAEQEAQLKKEREEREAADRKRNEEEAAAQRKRDEEAAEIKRKQDQEDADKKAAELAAQEKIANKKMFDQIKTEFPTVELAWVEIARLRKLKGSK